MYFYQNKLTKLLKVNQLNCPGQSAILNIEDASGDDFFHVKRDFRKKIKLHSLVSGTNDTKINS